MKKTYYKVLRLSAFNALKSANERFAAVVYYEGAWVKAKHK